MLQREEPSLLARSGPVPFEALQSEKKSMQESNANNSVSHLIFCLYFFSSVSVEQQEAGGVCPLLLSFGDSFKELCSISRNIETMSTTHGT